MGDDRTTEGLEEISLREYAGVLWRHKVMILLLTLSAAASGYGVSKFLLPPTYSATATMFVYAPSTPAMMNPTSFLYMEDLGQTYATLATSSSVLSKAIATYSLPVTEQKLVKAIVAAPVTNTNLFTITATAPSAVEAARWADDVSYTLRTKVSNMGQGIRLANPAAVPPLPTGPKTALNTALAGVLGFLVAVGVAFLMEYLDDTVKSEEEAAILAGAAVLGEIPYISGRDMAVVPPRAQTGPSSGKEAERWGNEQRDRVSST